MSSHGPCIKYAAQLGLPASRDAACICTTPCHSLPPSRFSKAKAGNHYAREEPFWVDAQTSNQEDDVTRRGFITELNGITCNTIATALICGVLFMDFEFMAFLLPPSGYFTCMVWTFRAGLASNMARLVAAHVARRSMAPDLAACQYWLCRQARQQALHRRIRDWRRSLSSIVMLSVLLFHAGFTEMLWIWGVLPTWVVIAVNVPVALFYLATVSSWIYSSYFPPIDSFQRLYGLDSEEAKLAILDELRTSLDDKQEDMCCSACEAQPTDCTCAQMRQNLKNFTLKKIDGRSQ